MTKPPVVAAYILQQEVLFVTVYFSGCSPEKKKASNRKWDSANLDRISLAIKQGGKAVIAEAAQKAGLSVNSYITNAVDAQLKRDGYAGLLENAPVPPPAAPDPVPADPVPEPMPRTAAVKPIPIHPKPSGSGETLEEVLARKRADRTTQQEAEAFEQRQRNPKPQKEDGTED